MFLVNSKLINLQTHGGIFWYAKETFSRKKSKKRLRIIEKKRKKKSSPLFFLYPAKKRKNERWKNTVAFFPFLNFSSNVLEKENSLMAHPSRKKYITIINFTHLQHRSDVMREHIAQKRGWTEKDKSIFYDGENFLYFSLHRKISFLLYWC